MLRGPGFIMCGPDAYGEAVVNGRLWRWEFHEFLGPTFLKANLEPRQRSPSEGHPVWDEFQKWLVVRYLDKKKPDKAQRAAQWIKDKKWLKQFNLARPVDGNFSSGSETRSSKPSD